MDCPALLAMRAEATTLFKDLAVRRRRAREYAVASSGQSRPGSARVPRGDFEAYLARRLAKSAGRIEAHILTHRCQA